MILSNSKKYILSFLLFVCTTQVISQEIIEQDVGSPVNIKTNLLYDATATLNLGAELRTGNNTSVDISVGWNPFTLSNNRKWKHYLIQPEFRLWTKEAFSGHFLGVHAHYALYNVSNLPRPLSQNMRDSRYQGWLLGVGLSYGYRWNFKQNWSMEATLGVGYAYMDYDKYPCGKCASKEKSGTRHYVGPTKAGVTLLYSFGGKAKSTQPMHTYL